MAELEPLYRRLEYARFSQRGEIAAEVAATAAPAELDELAARGLAHPVAPVRLGVIEIVRAAGHRAALAALLSHARGHEGDDRVFALRALAELARPGDHELLAVARGWLTAADAFVAAQAARVVAAVEPAPVVAPVPAAAPDPAQVAAAATLERTVVALFAATTTAERLARIAELEARGAPALAAAARIVLKRGEADVIALVARALIRHAAALPAPEALVPLIEAARRRLGGAPATDAALDDALAALAGPLAPSVLARIEALDRVQLDALAARLCARPAEEVALHAPRLLEALARGAHRWSSLGPVLVYAAPHLRPGARAELRQATDRVVDQLRAGETLHPVIVVSATRVLAELAEPGEVLPAQLDRALDRMASAEAAQARAALCARLATEPAAAILVAMLRDPLPAARAAAAAAVAAWTSPWIELAGTPPAIVTRYVDEDGQPLARLDDHVLDAAGRPVRTATTEYGGCSCCKPPRAIVRRGPRLRCPASWNPHGPEPAPAPEATDVAAAPQAPVLPPLVPTEHGRGGDDALPRPPSRDELAQMARPIRTAIIANVFLRARDLQQHWSGSGIVVARDGDHIAILTNRHVVESDDGRRLAVLSGTTVAGELSRARVVWRAGRGLDLALVEAQIGDPLSVEVMRLLDAPAQVGARVFAIGNPLGLAWSYSAGTLSAVRQWTTQEGLAVQVLQTDTAIAPGSSGGGLFHEDGRLLGVMSFARQGGAGGSVHFALGAAAVREALVREGVVWRGYALAGL